MLSRRTFLRSSGVAIGLPFLNEMQPRVNAAAPAVKRRMVAINIAFGFHAQNFNPTKAGRDYELSHYLKEIGDFREDFTVITGTSHPSVGGGHLAHKSFLSCAKNPTGAGFKNTISLDQFAAEQFGRETRLSSLPLTLASTGLSYSRAGVELPAEGRPSRVFANLFLEGKPEEKAKQIQRLREGQSVLDVVQGKAKRMSQRLGQLDRQKLDQYFTAVREAEAQLHKAEEWAARPKPSVDVKSPKDQLDRLQMLERTRLMYDMMHLAIQTDSTRFLTLYDPGMNAVPSIPGVDTDYHMLSHHGKDEAKIKQLAIVESAIMREFGGFLRKLNESQEDGGSLLDNTMVFLGSTLGNANSHDNRNMPIILAGGGFKHGQHLAFNQELNYPLANLFVSMLQRLGLEVDTFGSSTGTMAGLEMV